MNCRIINHLLALMIVAMLVFASTSCSSNHGDSSNSSGAAAKSGPDSGADKGNAAANANTSEQAAASQPPGGASPPPAGSELSAPAPPNTAPVPAPGGSAQEPPSAPAPAQPPPPPPPPPRKFTLASGRALGVITTSSLSTKSNKTGEPFVANLANAIVDGDWTIARKGAEVEGVIANSDPGGRVKGVASISVKLTRLTLADGRKIPISTSAYVVHAKTTKKKDAAKIGIGAGAGAIIGAIAGGGKGAAIGAGVGGGAGTAVVLATRGDPAVIPGESRVSFHLASPVTITERRDD